LAARAPHSIDPRRLHALRIAFNSRRACQPWDPSTEPSSIGVSSCVTAISENSSDDWPIARLNHSKDDRRADSCRPRCTPRGMWRSALPNWSGRARFLLCQWAQTFSDRSLGLNLSL
jgi:hypothetical protein